MRGTPPYIVRLANGDETADVWDEALHIARTGYDPSQAMPEIVDSTGWVVCDQAEIVELMLESQSSN